MAMHDKYTWFLGEAFGETTSYPVAYEGEPASITWTVPDYSTYVLPYEGSRFTTHGLAKRQAFKQAYLYRLKYYLITCRSLVADNIEPYRLEDDDPMELN